MKKPTPKPESNTETTAPILSLETISAMETPERLNLYRKCDERMRSQFLIQGKILHATEGGEEALRAAGIPKSSLHNAKLAAITLELTVLREAKDKGVMIHVGGKKAEPFTEAVYDGLTLEQCRLIAHGCTSRGQVTHRPLPQTFYAILKEKEWDIELEHYFQHGATRAMKQAMEEEAKRREALVAEGIKAGGTEASSRIEIPEGGEGEEVGGEVPCAPEIVSVPPVVEKSGEEETEGGGEGEKEPQNIVPFVSKDEGEGMKDEEKTPEGVIEPVKLEVLPPVKPETPSFKDITDHIGVLDEMIAHMDPVVSVSARQELANRLRALADRISATCAAVVEVETVKRAVKKGRKVA